MKAQTLYRGEAKKAKLTKNEKIYNYFAKVKRQEAAKKKESAA